MTAPVVSSTQLRCHHCQRWIGESSAAVVFVGMFKDPKDRELIPVPRDTYRCSSCKWVNVFRADNAAPQSWRQVELKQSP